MAVIDILVVYPVVTSLLNYDNEAMMYDPALYMVYARSGKPSICYPQWPLVQVVLNAHYAFK